MNVELDEVVQGVDDMFQASEEDVQERMASGAVENILLLVTIFSQSFKCNTNLQ